MSIARLVLPILFGLLLTTTAEAQWVRTARPVQRLDRWLGLGNGHGYHWKNPGPDSSWYNPWSSLNSTRFSADHAVVTDGWSSPGWTGDWGSQSFGTGLPDAGPAPGAPAEPTPAAPRDGREAPAGENALPDPRRLEADQAEAARVLDQQYQSSGWSGR